MVADLLCQGLALGLNREEIDELLGPADIDHGGSMVAYRIYSERAFWWESVKPPPSLRFVANTYLLWIGTASDDDYGSTVDLTLEPEN